MGLLIEIPEECCSGYLARRADFELGQSCEFSVNAFIRVRWHVLFDVHGVCEGLEAVIMVDALLYGECIDS